jgi:hypothetical protein
MLDRELDEIYALGRKYSEAPRKGWIVKGSRKRSNETIEVSRDEVKGLARDLHTALYCEKAFLYELSNLRHYMEQIARQIADNEGGLKHCAKCFCDYLETWLDGKCPYCEAAEAAASMLKGSVSSNDV